MTRYVEAFKWTGTIQRFLDRVVIERPLLNVCSGRTAWGDVTLDQWEPASVNADWTALPFETDSFGAVFADPPWNGGHKQEVAAFVREALRVAPIAYLMAPWIYGGREYPMTHCWIRQLPGINNAVILARYIRRTR